MRLFLLLGANLGDRFQTLDQARTQLSESVGAIVSESKLYETAPWGVTDQPPYLNQALELQTTLTPDNVLTQTQSIEQRLGRVRLDRWGARLIDIDLLYYDDFICQTEQLILPHPLLHERRFVLIPLCDIGPDFVHPVSGKTNAEMLRDCRDTGLVTPLNTHVG